MKLKEKYYSKKEEQELKEKYQDLYKLLSKKKVYLLFHKKERLFCKEYKQLSKIIVQKNQEYIKKVNVKYGYLLNNIGRLSLDKEQREAVFKEEDSHLIIAGAGSGKTLTMIGKIKYLIEVKKIPKEKILCLSFTNAITEDFKKNVYEKLGISLEVLTFHKLGLNILSKNKIPVSICDSSLLVKIIDLHLNDRLKEEEFLKKLNQCLKIDVKKTQNIQEIENLISTFLQLWKANGYDDKNWVMLEEEIKKEKNYLIRKRNHFLFSLCKDIYLRYETKLDELGQIDFNDMIQFAINLLKEGYEFPKYDYIIVDEYQDTSLLRYYLLKEIKEKNQCPLLAVGDDWQSIYRFTGCDLSIFTNFSKYFPNSECSKIQTTYRNCQELIDASGNFVMRNPSQIKKSLKSMKRLKKPIKIYYYEKLEEIENLVRQVIQNKKGEILLLGRNNYDINCFKENANFFVQEDQVMYQQVKMRFLTVHKSKGLQSDQVILLNLENKTLGFPNQLVDDPLLRYITKRDYFPYEEERRLFYVALTRTKNEVYLFVKKKNPSIFVEELLQNNRSQIQIMSKNSYIFFQKE